MTRGLGALRVSGRRGLGALGGLDPAARLRVFVGLRRNDPGDPLRAIDFDAAQKFADALFRIFFRFGSTQYVARGAYQGRGGRISETSLVSEGLWFAPPGREQEITDALADRGRCVAQAFATAFCQESVLIEVTAPGGATAAEFVAAPKADEQDAGTAVVKFCRDKAAPDHYTERSLAQLRNLLRAASPGLCRR